MKIKDFREMTSAKVFYAVSVIAATLFIFIYTFSPLEADDYWFLEGTQGMTHGWQMFLTACDTMKDRWLTDTGRLGNIINPVFLALLPKWVFNICSGISVFLLILFGCRLASARPGSLRSYLLLSAIVFCYPWYDYLFCITFGINYVIGMALVVVAAYYLLRSGRGGFSTILICLLGFIAGWIHEGFGVPLACGGIAVAVLRYVRHTLRRDYLVKLGSLCLGSIMICFSPVFWNRAETAVSNIYKFPLKEMIMQIGPGVLLFVAFILCLAIVISRKSWRARLLREGIEKTLFLGVVIIVSFAVMMKYYNGPRTGAGVVMFASIGIVALLQFIRVRIPRAVQIISKVILAAAVLLNLGFAVAAQKKLLKEYNEVTALYEDSPTGQIYYNLTYPKADLSMFKTTVRQFHERIPKRQLAQYLDADKELVILPTAILGLRAERLTPASRPGFYLYRGYIVTAPDVEIESPQITVDIPGATNVSTRFRSDAFRDETGKEWIFIMPHIQTLDESLRITDVIP